MPLQNFIHTRFGGVNVESSAFTMAAEEAQKARNVSLTQKGTLSVFPGRTTHNTLGTGTAVISGVRGVDARSGMFTATSGKFFLYDDDAGNVYSDNAVDGAETLVQAGFTAGKPFFSVLANDGAYRLNGSDAPHFYHDGATDKFTPWGIAAPTFTTAVAQSVGGSLTLLGAYQYRVVYFVSGTYYQSHSNPNAAKAITLTGGNNRVSLTGLTASTHPRVTHKRIYRTLAGGTVFYFVAQISNAATGYTDTSSDATISVAETLESVCGTSFTDCGVCPTGNFAAIHQDRIFVSGAAANPNRVYWSLSPSTASVRYDEFPSATQWVDVGSDADPVMGMFSDPDNNWLIVVKKRSVWRIVGTDNTNYQAQLLLTVGALTKTAVTQDIGAGRIFFLSSKGVVQYDSRFRNDQPMSGLQYLSISRINGPNKDASGEKGIFDASVAELETAVLAFDPVGEMLRLSVKDSGSADNDHEWVWHFPYPAPDMGALDVFGNPQPGAVSKWTRNSRGYACYVYHPDTKRMYCGDAAIAKVWREHNGTDDDGTRIQPSWKSKEFNLGGGGYTKEFMDMTVEARGEFSHFHVLWSMDFGSSTETVEFVNGPGVLWDGQWDGAWATYAYQSHFENVGQAATGNSFSFEIYSNETGTWTAGGVKTALGDLEIYGLAARYEADEDVIQEAE